MFPLRAYHCCIDYALYAAETVQYYTLTQIVIPSYTQLGSTAADIRSCTYLLPLTLPEHAALQLVHQTIPKRPLGGFYAHQIHLFTRIIVDSVRVTLFLCGY